MFTGANRGEVGSSRLIRLAIKSETPVMSRKAPQQLPWRRGGPLRAARNITVERINPFASRHGKLGFRRRGGRMPVPNFTIHGVLPPYIGPNGPGGDPSDMSPFEATVLEVTQRFSTTTDRRVILRHWLQHRSEMAGLGMDSGFQWLDGSFVEDKTPNDIDVITFFRRPVGHESDQGIGLLFVNQADVLRRPMVKARLRVDAMFVDLNATPERTVHLTRYYGSLFSHRRGDDLWKGMVSVPLDPATDTQALALLDAMDLADAAAAPQGAVA